MMLRDQFSLLVAPNQMKYFDDTKDTALKAQQYPEVFKVEDVTDMYVEATQMAGFGPAQEKPENTPIVFNDAIPGGVIRHIVLTYALGYQMSWELSEDDKSGFFKGLPKALVDSHMFTEEVTAWNEFNNGFTTTITIDGVTLFNNQHPLLGGPAATNITPGIAPYISAPGTYPNRPPVDIDPSYAAIQYMTNVYRRTPNQQGLMAMIKPRVIIHPPELRFLFDQLLGSPGMPGSATNDINALIGEDLKHMSIDALTSQTAWFASAGKEYTHCRFFRRKALFQDLNDDFKTRALEHVAISRYTVGVDKHDGLWGTTGAS